MEEIALPGSLLYSRINDKESPIDCGSGTFEKDSKIYASIVGKRSTSTKQTANGSVDVVKVEGSRGTRFPLSGDVAVCQVTRIVAKQATVQILSIGKIMCSPVTFKGTIRSQDVRATERDKVSIQNSFRPGDILVCEVIGIADASLGYLLTTAKNELGVIFAKSLYGHVMIPISWEEMQCPQTKIIERRKCAKFSL